ncbi:MAG: CPXCG motif-containing cysteine-rich protein [Bacteroidota bacterium]
MLEHFFQCPYCGEPISFLLDQSVPAQSYVEDCEVCCNPIEVTVQFKEQELQHFSAQILGQ